MQTKNLYGFLMLVVFWGVSSWHAPVVAQTVTFPDANLAAAIRTRLGLGSTDPITRADLADSTFTTLQVNNQEVADISGLEYATSLTLLELTQNQISDLSPLSTLTSLTNLRLNDNQISDISALKALTSLTHLDLPRNQISDISALKALTSLTTLVLEENQISDISVLKELTNLDGFLELNDNQISDISSLKGLANITRLHLYNNKIKTVNGLSGFTSLTHLELYDNEISDISGLPALTSLRELNLWNNKISDISSFSGLTSLRELNLWDNQVSDISALSGLTSLTDLTLWKNQVSDISALSGLTSLTYLDLDDNQVSDISALSGLTSLRDLYFTKNRVSDISALSGLTSLRRLGACHNLYTDISPITSLPRLRSLSIDETFVEEAEEAFSAAGRTVRITACEALPPPPSSAGLDDSLIVTFEDYPEGRPTEEFTLTLKFSEPVIGVEKQDITLETELDSGTATPTLVALIPETPIPPEGPNPTPISTYIARIDVPPRAAGTVKLIVLAGAAIGVSTEGPAAATASDPIKFGRRRSLVFPSSVAMDTIIFNEFRNAPDDTNDWLELKNISDEPVSLRDWEVSLVVPHTVSPVAPLTDIYAMDKDIVAFPEWTLPPGEILLIMNTDPSENDLLRGQSIEKPEDPPKRRPFQLRAPDMKLPNGPYLLILRSARDKNGIPAAFEDLLGEYHKGDVSYRTQIWPLRDTWVYTGTAVDLSAGEVYERVMVPRVTGLDMVPRLQPEKRGYLRGAWVMSDYQYGLGYDPEAPSETSLGTPGYPNVGSVPEIGGGTLSISEVMFATHERGSPSQWIELYNASATEIVDLEGWMLKIEVRDSQPVHRHTTFGLKSLQVMPNETVLLVARQDRSSQNIPMSRIYELQRRNRHPLVLRSEGFAVRLLSRDGTLVDIAGNLDGRMGRDPPRWQLPSGWMEDGSRTSLIRRYEAGVPLSGTVSGGWVRAGETALIGAWTYYGLPGDHGTPGYRQGSPLPVELSSLRADLREGSVVVKWTTASEMENAGFHVLRSRENGSGFVQVNPALIPGAGTTAEGQTYTYRDTTVVANVPYYYRLEEVSLSGERRAVATVRLRGHISATNKVLWKWADVKTQDYSGY